MKKTYKKRNVIYKEIAEDAGEFDSVAETYDDGFEKLMGVLGRDSDRFAEYKVQLVHHFINDQVMSILDFGCGIGRSLEYFKKYYSHNTKLFGCDTSEESVRIAKRSLPEAEIYLNSTVEGFSARPEHYDIVFLACVLHHIIPDERDKWIDAIIDKTNSGGYIAIFEHNLKNPYTKSVVNNPENILDHEEYMLSHEELIRLLTERHNDVNLFWDGYVLFSPIRFKWSTTFELLLRRVPLGGQHCVIVKKE